MGTLVLGFGVLFACTFLCFPDITAASTFFNLTLGQSIKDGDILVSANATFELGFFSPGSSANRYLGIQYKTISPGTVVWVGNRENPISDRLGMLNVTDQGVLVLYNSSMHAVWKTNSSVQVRNPVVLLLDSGNLFVQDGDNSDPDNFVWQSFDYPSETLLPGMKLGWNLVTGLHWYISSWKSTDDPARGNFSWQLDPRGYMQMVVMKGSQVLYRTGTWNGNRWSGVPELIPNMVYTEDVVMTPTEVYYHFQLISSSVPSRLIINSQGFPQRLTWQPQSNLWAPYTPVQIDQCDSYAKCGPNGQCRVDEQPMCSCLKGYVPKIPEKWNISDWTDGCVRRAPLGCNNGDGFLTHPMVKLPDMIGTWINRSMSLDECKDACFKNCTCNAYANSDVIAGGSGCYLWFGDLVDLKELETGGQDIYIKMAASELRDTGTKGSSSTGKKAGIIIGTVLAIAGLLILGYILYLRRKRPRDQVTITSSFVNDHEHEKSNEDVELPTFDITTIAIATDDFSLKNKLGEGGFGTVYKGTLIEGQEIAVKRLSSSSGQGLKEFKNEVILIAKLQHRNLVKLLGCCIEGDERMLIYEFMPNKSLNYFIFDPTCSKLLDWPKRINIIAGIARGLLYLHQDSRLRIIHRDLKASNVLLDNSMNPRISDFGMARTFGGDQLEGNTNRIVGTYGYMAPEYAVDGLFSIKSDVFSFGVIVLEIISGKKNRGFFHPDHFHNLLGHAWTLWNEGRPLELMDKAVDKSYSVSDVMRCIHVGLLCVQRRPEDRPTMSTVVVMLSSDVSLPQPKQPGFFTERNLTETESSSSDHILRSSSRNDISFTSLEPR